MRQKKPSGGGFRLIAPRGDDDYDEWADEMLYGAHHRPVIVTEGATRKPEFTGVLDPEGMPIFRFYMSKPGMGFLVEGLEDYDPDAYMYGVPPAMKRMTVDDLLAMAGEDEEEEQEEEEE